MLFNMEIISMSVFLFVAIVAFLLWRHLTRFRGYLEGLGLPIDRTVHWMMHKTDFTGHDVKCLQKFGSLWGKYSGVMPEIVVADPAMVKEVMVKHFDCFTNRIYIGIEEQHMSLIDAHVDKWPVIRKALSPTFTSGKLKYMTGQMDNVVNNLMTHLESQLKVKGRVVNVKPIFQCLSLDTIANCAFGIETNSFEKPNNVLFQRCVRAFTDLQMKNMTENLMGHVYQLFPGLMGYMDVYGKENYTYLRDLTKNIVDVRKTSRGDFIDRLKEFKDEVSISNALTENMIMAQGIAFFIAGFETSSNTMSTLCYNLAMNPEVQDKIVEEISEVLEKTNGHIDHEIIGHLEYLEAVVEENLRIYPPVTRLHRTCNKECKIGSMTVKKDVPVVFPIWAMHHNPDIFPEPDLFKPERFLKEAKSRIPPFAYIPFGGGPRMCIGLRFAMAEMKIALTKLLFKYQIVKVPETKLDIRTGDAFFLSYPEVVVKLEPRP